MVLEALIFDVDGTLADTERDGHRPAFNAAFEAMGLEWHWDEDLYGKLLKVTGGKERIQYFIREFLPPDQHPPAVEALVAQLHRLKTQRYTELISSGVLPLRPGVRRLLEEARAAGLRLAIATTTTPANVTALLQASLAPDGERWFEVIAAGDVVPAKKPAPDIYLWALQQLGLPASACIALEDSSNGLRASLGAGLPTVVTVNDYTRQEPFDGAWAVLSDLGEPEAPCQILHGDLNGAGWVTASLLQAIPSSGKP